MLGAVVYSMSLFFSFSASCSLPASAKLTKIVKTEKRNTKFKKMQFWELSFGGSDVLFIVYNYIHRSSILSLFSFLFRVFQARWLAYTCHHRTWQSVDSERYCRNRALSLSLYLSLSDDGITVEKISCLLQLRTSLHLYVFKISLWVQQK